MQRVFDAAVVGLGAMGSAALWHLARRGLRVVGFDRHAPPHHLGSSHGESRIIRAAYHEHPLYVPLVQRAAALWAELAAGSALPLLAGTGGVMIGPEGGPLVSRAAQSAREHGLPHERWSFAELRRRVPDLRVPNGFAAVWEPGAGVLAPERCVAAMLAEARRHGAEILTDTPVIGWSAAEHPLRVATDVRDFRAERMVLAAGPWMPDLLTNLPLPLTRERVVQCWFSPEPGARPFTPDRLPLFLVEREDGRLFYGLPDLGRGVKAAFHHEGTIVSVHDVARRVSAEEVLRVRQALAAWVPGAAGPLREATVCLYTNTPDGHFVLDRHPRVPEVLVVSCCSGHGFKFASAIGEIAADLVTDRPPPFDLRPFRLGRFLGAD